MDIIEACTKNNTLNAEKCNSFASGILPLHEKSRLLVVLSQAFIMQGYKSFSELLMVQGVGIDIYLCVLNVT